MFEKTFTNRDEAKEYCTSMVEEHPNVELWIYEENLEPERVVNRKGPDKKEPSDQATSNEPLTEVIDMKTLAKTQRVGIVISAIWLIVALLFAMNSYRTKEIVQIFLVIGGLPVAIYWGIWWIRRG